MAIRPLSSDLGFSGQLRTPKLLTSLMKNDGLKKSGEQAYQAFLGYYNSNLRRLNIDKRSLVVIANEFSPSIGFDQRPEIFKKTVRKIGFKNTPGIRIKSH
jgi:ATP-dependent RNA helicase MSS116